jgi:lactoylglutathione lyase
MKRVLWIAGFSLSLIGTTAVAKPDPQSGAAVRADHLAIHVANQDASVAFYQGAFDLAEIPNPVNGPRWFDLGNGLSLHIIPGRTDPLITSKSVHLALRVASIDKLTAYLDGKKIAWQDWNGAPGKVQLRPDGVRQIYLRDPDGYWLEVNEAPAI